MACFAYSWCCASSVGLCVGGGALPCEGRAKRVNSFHATRFIWRMAMRHNGLCV